MTGFAKCGGVTVAVLAASVATLSLDAATVSLEIASEGRTQITAPQEWLQLFSEAGVASTRLRGARAGDRPGVESIGGSRGEVYHVLGVLTPRGELLLPGGRFTKRDAGRLRDYFDRLKADGPEALTEPTGSFGLTKKQFEAVFEDLTRAVIVQTKGKPLAELVEAAGERLQTPLSIEPSMRTKLRTAEPLEDELKSLTFGAALVIALRGEGLALTPTKPRGEAVQLRVAAIDPGAESWPIGYDVNGPPRAAAPDIMQAINVEIDGFTLAEAAAAITPRLETPVLWDHWSLAQRGVDPSEVQVQLPRAKLSYKRILEKLVFQARLRGKLRVDEAGTPFFWITGER